MYNSNTIFKQILHTITRYEFDKAVKAHNGDFAAKGISCYDQFTAMLFAQFTGQTGLRGIENGLEANKQSLYHTGAKVVSRTTLSYANTHRPAAIYEELFYSLFAKVAKHSTKHRLRFKNPLYSVDATTIDLCLNMFEWASFRTRKGGIKVHVKLDHHGCIPAFINVTTAKTHEVKQLRAMSFQKGDVLAFDRGYTDFKLFASYCNAGIYFVTRLKKNADYKVVKRNDVSKYANITSDQIIEMKGFYTSQKCPLQLRRIRSRDPETGKCIEILTNHLTWSAQTIAAVYKQRWQIEIFFKTIKQNLKIKSFLGTSKNAVMTQIWIVMIAFLLLKYLTFLSTKNWTVSALKNLLSSILFVKKDIWIILNKPKPERLTLINNFQLEFQW